MRTKSNIKPETLKLNMINKNNVEVLLAENISKTDDGFEYDLYTISVPYRENLENAIRQNPDAWLAYAKARQTEVVYTTDQLLQQEITELQLENIEQGQQITDLELIILEG